ncbi:MAG: glycosyltransferase [Acidimicrobiia bacterium]|nr:glycosyltransferase [Acidimicrobiia bacterium]
MFELTTSESEEPFKGTVPGNQWPRIPVQALSDFEPSLRVAVVVPFFEDPEALELTLIGLAHQTYPSSLMEVVVADDGSEPPFQVPADHNGLQIRGVRQERDGFGLARARNLGARSNDADILVFLDADMVPVPEFVAAHARWHHLIPDGMVVGFRKHVDFEAIGPKAVRKALAEHGSLDGLFRDRLITTPEWIERHIERTGNLTSEHDDLYRVASGGNLSLRREFYLQLGGNDESFTEYGGEDNEFAYRALLAGAVIIPERAALAWHQGAGGWQQDDDGSGRRLTHINLQQRISEQSLRHSRPGRGYLVPHVGVVVHVRDEPVEQVILVVESILGNWFHDLHIEVRCHFVRPDSVLLAREFEFDPRVTIVDPNGPPIKDVAAVQMTVPLSAVLGPRTVDKVLAELQHGGPGALHLTVPQLSPSDGLVEVTQRRSVQRALRHVGALGSLPDALATLFGERWMPGGDFEIERYEAGNALAVWTPPGERTVIVRPTMEIDENKVTQLAKRLQRTESDLSNHRRRKVVRFMNLVGAVTRMKGVRAAARKLTAPAEEVRDLEVIEDELRSLIRRSPEDIQPE